MQSASVSSATIYMGIIIQIHINKGVSVLEEREVLLIQKVHLAHGDATRVLNEYKEESLKLKKNILQRKEGVIVQENIQ